jgi:hypothetical protein
MSRIHRLTTAAGTTLAVMAIAAGPASAQSQDLRSPDARDASAASSVAGTTSGARQDLRSPDSRDAAEGRGVPVVVRVDRTVEQGQGQGLSWDSIGLGALMTAGLLASIAGAFVLIGRRRGHGPRVA